MKKAIISLSTIFFLTSCALISSSDSISSQSASKVDTDSSYMTSSNSNQISSSNTSNSEINTTSSATSSNFTSISSSSNTSKNDNSEELLADNDFNSLSSWTIYHDNNTKLDVINNGNNTINLNVNNKEASTNWANQILQKGLILKENFTYSISFKITSTINRDIQFLIQQDTNYDPTPLSKIISLTANQECTINTSVLIPLTSSYLYGFMLGNVNGTTSLDHTISISDVSLKGYKEEIKSSNGLDGTYDAAPTTKHGLNLAWSDEFNGTSLDETKWSNDIGTGAGGWGNNEQQYYTARKENCSVSNGSLKITALKESYNGSSYTSAKIISKGKYQTKYGYIETRMALPSMSGIWPAFWMLGANINQTPWPYCGEIDIMEAINYNSNFFSTLHWNEGTSENHQYKSSETIDVGDRTEYHTYGFLWTENEMKFYSDDTLYYVFSLQNNDSLNCFKKDFYFIFNVAVGGNLPGFNIGNDFPMTMSVDYIRVFQ